MDYVSWYVELEKVSQYSLVRNDYHFMKKLYKSISLISSFLNSLSIIHYG